MADYISFVDDLAFVEDHPLERQSSIRPERW